jgi:hypothetical protein
VVQAFIDMAELRSLMGRLAAIEMLRSILDAGAQAA